MRVVLTYGTFDLFHIGHVNQLRRARALGDRLIVGVSTDEFNAIKGKRTTIPFEDRVEIVKSIRYVDAVVPETSWAQKSGDIKRYGVTCFVMGDDWKGRFDDLKEYCEVLYLPRTEEISTSQLKTVLSHPHSSMGETRRIRPIGLWPVTRIENVAG